MFTLYILYKQQNHNILALCSQSLLLAVNNKCVVLKQQTLWTGCVGVISSSFFFLFFFFHCAIAKVSDCIYP